MHSEGHTEEVGRQKLQTLATAFGSHHERTARISYFLQFTLPSSTFFTTLESLSSWLLQIRHHETTNELASRGRKRLPLS